MLEAQTGLCVLHVAELSDRDSLQTLRRTMPVIAAANVQQVLLALSDAGDRDACRSAAAGAELRTLSCAGPSLFGKLQALRAELARLGRERSVHAVHLHGVAACLLGPRALRGSVAPGRVLCSPHLSRYGSAWTRALVGRVLRGPLQALHCAGLAASAAEALTLSRLLNRCTEVLPDSVSGVFFDATRRESAQPNVLADGWGAAAVDLVTRLSVLLNSRGTRVPISWLGAVEGKLAARVSAAAIEALAAGDDGMRARSLSRASAFVYVAPRERMAPLLVAQAMGAGVPCLVSDTPSHRALVRHGETGFICSSEFDFVEALILLLRSPGERARIGAAARAEAERWFTSRNLERTVLRAYGFVQRGPKDDESHFQIDAAHAAPDPRPGLRAVHAGSSGTG